ncbi:MAG: aminotransferase class I/II-fold pyridoxal phosphate-dependent enzyme [Ignavibacteriales bacterium]|nr:aminotransferase class I/II-fold pyridoxal phosphate-dependent enzyme [Ignavibacteriales bacterium]
MKKKISQQLSIATRAIHGKQLFAFKGPVATPIYQTSTYRFETSEDAIRYAKGDPSVYVYSRYHNPTVHDVEEKLALMENGEAAAIFASGMAAITTAILAVTKAGDNIISTPALYGGTYRWMRDELPKQNISVRFVDPHHLEEIARIADNRTTIVYIETPTNPTLAIVDIAEAVRQTKHAEKRLHHPILTMIDNTFATILNQDPFKFGVDVITESATKYLGGHTDILAGVVVGKEEFVKRVRALGKYHGGCADPFAAYLLGRSLKTFELRVHRQNENALALAHALEKNKRVNRVIYPGLLSHPQFQIAKKQMTGFGGMVTIEVKPSKRYSPIDAAAKVCDHLKVAVNAMSLGGVETLVSIPVYSSHVFMSDEELKRHGVTAGMIRISVGVEGIEDLIEDFEQALNMI